MNKLYTKKDGYMSFSLAVGAYLFAQFAIGLFLKQEDIDNGTFVFWLCSALLQLVIGAMAFGYAKIYQKDFLTVTTANKKPKIAHCLWGCLAVFGLIHFMTPVNNWLCDLIEAIGLKRPDVDLPLQIAPLIIVGSILPAIAEELLFRGTIGMGLVNGATQKWKGILATGALFALFHLNPAQTVHQFVLGSFLMLLAYRSGSVWTATVVHLFNNLLVVLLSVTVPLQFYLDYDVVICIVGAVVFGLSVWGYLATTKCHAQKPTQQDNRQDNHQQSPAQNNGQRDYGVGAFVASVVVCALIWILQLFS